MPATPVTCEYPESAVQVKPDELTIKVGTSDQSKPQSKLSQLEILCRGISNIKALIDGADQPSTDIEMAFYLANKH